MKATPTEAEILRHVESMVDATAEDEKLKIMNLFASKSLLVMTNEQKETAERHYAESKEDVRQQQGRCEELTTINKEKA